MNEKQARLMAKLIDKPLLGVGDKIKVKDLTKKIQPTDSGTEDMFMFNGDHEGAYVVKEMKKFFGKTVTIELVDAGDFHGCYAIEGDSHCAWVDEMFVWKTWRPKK